MFSVEKQEVSTKYLINKRYHDGKTYHNVTINVDSAKMLLKTFDVSLSSRYYLTMQHDIVAKASYNTIIKNRNVKGSLLQESDRVFKHRNDEFWWDLPIKMSTNIKHNKPDIVIWNHKDCQCAIVEFSCRADKNWKEN